MRPLELCNAFIPDIGNISMKCSDGRMRNFKRIWGLKTLKAHVESGEADEAAMMEALSLLRTRIVAFELRKEINADDFAYSTNFLLTLKSHWTILNEVKIVNNASMLSSVQTLTDQKSFHWCSFATLCVPDRSIKIRKVRWPGLACQQKFMDDKFYFQFLDNLVSPEF